MGSEEVVKGAKFGRWTVLDIGIINPTSKAKQKVKCALCECSCEKHTHRLIPYRDLYAGRSQSCGCIKREQTIQMNWDKGTIALGTRFGKLTIIEDLGYRKELSRDKQIRWYKCKCDCGNIINVRANHLKTGNTKSCGCVQSYGETLISTILRENDVMFIQQYKFQDLRGDGDYMLRFDFAIFKDNKLYRLIEFQGRQHYTGPEAQWTHGNSLEVIQKYDKLKVDYCKDHNIDLLVIPYTDINKLNIDYLLN